VGAVVVEEVVEEEDEEEIASVGWEGVEDRDSRS